VENLILLLGQIIYESYAVKICSTIEDMTAALIFIGLLLLLGYFESKKRQKTHNESFDAYIGDLNKMVDTKLDEALKKAEEIGRENGID